MSGTVLVVDDDAGIADLLADLLAEEGYAVLTAADGDEALAEVEREPVDLVLTDVMLPGVDGVTLSERLRQRGDQTPVVLMSAVFDDVDIPGVRFVPKPFDLDYMVGVVDSVLAEARASA